MEVSTQPRPSASSVGIRYGLLTGIISIIISFALFATNMDQSPLRYLTSVVLIGGIVMAMRYYKENNAGFMSYGQGLGIGTTLSAVTGVLSAIFTYIYVSFIDSEAISRMMEKAQSDMEARGNLSDEQIEQAMAMTAKFMTVPMLTVMVLVMSILMGFIVSLIVGAIMKHTKPEFE
jgi:hypothetical protein